MQSKKSLQLELKRLPKIMKRKSKEMDLMASGNLEELIEIRNIISVLEWVLSNEE